MTHLDYVINSDWREGIVLSIVKISWVLPTSWQYISVKIPGRTFMDLKSEKVLPPLNNYIFF
jgi:hypothetical protein